MKTVLLAICVACSLAAAERPRMEMVIKDQGRVVLELFPDQAPETVKNFMELAEGKKSFTDSRSGETLTRPFYDGLTFHRVIANFMIQGGDPQGDGSGGPGFRFADEINAQSLGLDKELAMQADGQLNPWCSYMAPQIQQALIMPALQAKGLSPQSDKAAVNAVIGEVVTKLKSTSLMRLYEQLGYRYRTDLPASSAPTRGMLCMANAGPGTNGSQFFINLVDTPHLNGKHTVFGRVVEGMNVIDAIARVPVEEPSSKPKAPVVIERIRVLE